MIDPFWYTSSVDRSPCRHRERHGRGDQHGQGRPRHASPSSRPTPTRPPCSSSRPRWRSTATTSASSASRTKSDATYEQYAKPLWNSWAQFYTKVDQEKLLDYATDLHDNGLDGHTIQLDDKWESNYGNLTWDPKTFPDPKGMSRQIHDMGFDFGLWVTLWINLDSDNYQYAVDNGYLLMDAKDTEQAVRSDLVERPSRDHRPGEPRRQGLVRGQPQEADGAHTTSTG